MAGPPDRPGPLVPVEGVLDRAAVERVLARAAELQTQSTGGEGEPGEADQSDLISEAQLIAAGAEVGLSVTHIRQAIAEERTRIGVPAERGLAAQFAGAGMASASRTVIGTPADVLAAVHASLTRDESMTIKRRYAERWTWEPRRDFWAMFRRIGGWRFDLQHATEVAATVVAVDDQRVTIRLDADVSRTRSARLEQGAGVAAGGVAVGGGMVGIGIVAHLILAPVLLAAVVPVAAGAVGGYMLARRHRQTVERTQLVLEQVLDRLEHGDLRRALPPGRPR
jgi:hypothetical protein